MLIKNEQQLVDLGFHKYEKTPFDHDGVKYRYQKRYDDEKGKKYFLDCKVWDWTRFPNAIENYTYEFETQVYLAKTHNAVNMKFLTADIDEIEATINSMFSAGLLEHYETWEDC